MAGAATSSQSVGVLVAFDARTGEERWRAATPGTFGVEDVSKRVVAGRGFPCTSGPFQTLSYRAADGKKRWQAQAGDYFPSSRGANTLATGSTSSGIVLSATAEELDGVDAVSGRVRWSVPISGAPLVTATADTVLIAHPEGSFSTGIEGVVRAVDRSTGASLWSTSEPGSDAPFVVADSKSVVASFGRLDGSTIRSWVLDPRTGSRRWETDLGVAGAGGSVIVFGSPPRDPESTLVGLDAQTGEQLWSRPGGSGTLWSLGKRLGMLDATGFTVVKARTGEVLWNQPGVTGGVAVDARSAAFVDGTKLNVVDAKTGKARWRSSLPTGYEGVNTLAVTGDTVYVGLGCFPNAD